MGKRVIITENQLSEILSNNILNESIFEASSFEEFKMELYKIAKKLLIAGVALSVVTSMVIKICNKQGLSQEETKAVVEEVIPVNQEKNKIETPLKQSDWVLVDDKTIATVYNAKPNQCDNDFGVTATMFRLNLDDVLSHDIIAMERTFLTKLGLKRGDVVKIEGTGKWDGVKQIQDVMNKRFRGQHRIDILVPDNITNGKWSGVKIYKLRDNSLENKYKSKMAPQVSKQESERLMNKKRIEYNKNK